MVFFIIEFLRSVFDVKIPQVFEYYSTRMMLAALTTLCLCIFLGPRFIKKLYELKIGQPIRMEECPTLGHLHSNKKDTPTMGGILILISMVISLLLWMDLTSSFTLILLVTTIWLGGIGARDDYLKLRYKNSKGLAGRKKMALQVLFGAVLAIYLLCPTVAESIHVGKWFAPPIAKEQVMAVSDTIPDRPEHAKGTVLQAPSYVARLYVPFFKEPVYVFAGPLLAVLFLFIIAVVTGSSNAVNLTDGLDGLAAGCLVIVAGVFAFYAFISNNIDWANYLHILYIEQSGEIAIYLSAMAGACLGFLWFNGAPAQVFMGDTGSLALGGIIGVSAVLIKKELLLVIVGGIFVIETLSVILQVASYRLRNKKRIFLCTPIHHHFEFKGWAETKVVIRFWIVGLLFAIVGILAIKFQ